MRSSFQHRTIWKLQKLWEGSVNSVTLWYACLASSCHLLSISSDNETLEKNIAAKKLKKNRNRLLWWVNHQTSLHHSLLLSIALVIPHHTDYYIGAESLPWIFISVVSQNKREREMQFRKTNKLVRWIISLSFQNCTSKQKNKKQIHPLFLIMGIKTVLGMCCASGIQIFQNTACLQVLPLK